ncbi:MAG: hypothetical protein ACPGU7_09930 [Gammaproteobacteria bacterium]
MAVSVAGTAAAFDHPRWYDARHLAAAAQRISALPHVSATACARPYAPMYRDGTLNISLFFGFAELTHSDIVVDPYNVRAFLKQLRKPCVGGLQACGFHWSGRPASADAPFVLTRLLPSSSGVTRARIRLFDSAVNDELGPILERSRRQQTLKTERVRAHFRKALVEEDAVFYLGHSRLGSGPGFGTFETLSAPWWQAMLLNGGTRAMSDALRVRSSPLPLLGLFSCDSRAHYQHTVTQASPETALVVSDDTTYVDDDSVRLFATLNAVLARQCEPALRAALTPVPTPVPTAGQTPRETMARYHLPGWFESAPPPIKREPTPFPDLAWGSN